MPTPDYRCLEYPYDDEGYPFFAEDEDATLLNPKSQATFDDYLQWLSKCLSDIKLQPRDEQLRWWNEHSHHAPEAAIRRLGVDLGLQDALDHVLRHHQIDSGEISELDWEWPHNVVPPIDLGYRILLAEILKPVEDPVERTRLLDTFFCMYWDYRHK